MKKGFTLIELLAVITILSIIMLIAIPRVLDAIENSRISAYKNDEQMMVKATETYLGNNADLLPENVGKTIEVTLNDLKTNEFIGDVSDQSGNCNGYILVTKIEDGYSYNPELKCGASNTIASNANDGLVVHYTFDDYQEATENLYSVSSNSRSLAIIDGNNTLSYGESISINNQYAERIIKDVGTPSAWASYRKCLSIPAGTIITYSYKIKLNSGDISSVGAHFGGGTFSKEPYENIGDIYYYKGTGSLGGDTYCVGAGFVGDAAVDVYVFEPQIEIKDYATPFTNYERLPYVTDYSLNDYDAPLTVENTPKWAIDSNSNEGVYYFDGDNDYIEISTNTQNILPSGTRKWSYGAWVKTEFLDTRKAAILSNYDSDAGDSVVSLWLLQYNNKWGTYLRGVSGLEYIDSGVNIDGDWNHLFVTIDYNEGTYTISLYVNGKLTNSKSITTTFDYIDTAPLRIGGLRYYDGITDLWRGYIDDIKIYNRSLSAEEIKYQYDTTKSMYK